MSRHRRIRRPLSACAVALTTVAFALGSLTATSTPATASPLPPPPESAATDARIYKMLNARATSTTFGTSFSGAVIDAGSNRLVWGKGSTTALMPASNAKLVTASNALAIYGPERRIVTRVRGGSSSDQVILVGSGDPSLSSANLDALAKTTAATLKARGRTTARVYIDDSLFPPPSLAPGWPSSYVPTEVAPVRALVRDVRNLSDTSADAGGYLTHRISAYGVSASYKGRTRVAAGAPTIASTAGQRLDQIVASTLLFSHNQKAEMLYRLVGLGVGYGTTWSASASATRTQLARRNLSVSATYDGSGLSRSNRQSALQTAKIIDANFDSANNWTLAIMRSPQAMPTAGRTGTLTNRFQTTASSCAIGKVWAKTGTLDDAMALSGWTQGTDGRVKVFSFIVNGKADSTVRNGLDMLAATVNGCY